MSILCRLGRHRAGPRPRWNEGYYFSTCKGCGRDLVRTPFEGWKVPVGYRVVWSARPPEDRPSARLAPEPPFTPVAAPAAAAIPATGTALLDAPARDGLSGETPAAPTTAGVPAHDPAGGDDAPGTAGAAGRSVFPWGDAQDPAGSTGSSTDLSIRDVLRILREEERRGGPPPEGGTIEAEAEPLELELGQVEADPHASSAPRDDPEVAGDSDARAPEASDQPETRAVEQPDTPAPAGPGKSESAALSPAAAPFADFMDEFGPAPSVTEFWDPAPPAPATAGAAEAGLPASPAADAPTATQAGEEREDPVRPEGPGGERAEEVAAGHEAPQSPVSPEDGPAIEARADEADEAPLAPSGEYRPFGGHYATDSRARHLDARDRARRRNRQRSRTGFRVAVASAVALAAAFVVTRVSGNDSPVARSAPASAVERSAPAGTATVELAFAALAQTECRAGPAADARALRVLPRGEPVAVVERGSGWVSVTHAEGQCWVPEAALAGQPPE